MIALDDCVLAWLRGLCDLPVGYCEFPADQDCYEFDPSPTQETVYQYRAGGGMFGYAYELYLRVRPRDAADRMDAARRLSEVAQAVTGRSFPEAPDGCVWSDHQLTERPGLHAAYDDGREELRLVARITYIERS